MVSAQKYLEKCSALSDKNISFEFEQGMVIARGFADLGFEEFILLSSSKICSLYSGKISELPEEDKKRFFCVPDEDMMINRIVKMNFDVISLVFQDQRDWKLNVKNINTEELKTFEGTGIKDVLLECLLAIS